MTEYGITRVQASLSTRLNHRRDHLRRCVREVVPDRSSWRIMIGRRRARPNLPNTWGFRNENLPHSFDASAEVSLFESRKASISRTHCCVLSLLNLQCDDSSFICTSRPKSTPLCPVHDFSGSNLHPSNSVVTYSNVCNIHSRIRHVGLIVRWCWPKAIVNVAEYYKPEKPLHNCLYEFGSSVPRHDCAQATKFLGLNRYNLILRLVWVKNQ